MRFYPMQELVMNERQTNDRHTASGALGVQELDPVCGMKVDSATSKHRLQDFAFLLCWLREQVRSGP